MSKRRGLGRGLEQLIPTGGAGFMPVLGGPGTRDVPIALIDPNPEQPRTNFDEASLRALSESIQAFGILQPLVVEANGERFRLVAGERRLRAAQLAGLGRVPAVVRPVGPDREKLEVALVENLQRSDISALDEARAFARLCDVFGMTQEQVGQRVGRSRSAVANTMRLLQTAPAVQVAIQGGQIAPAHGRALLSLSDLDAQVKMLDRIVAQNLSVRETERLVGQRVNQPSQRSNGPDSDHGAALGAIEEALTQRLSTRVKVVSLRKGRGRIVIEYFSDEELNGLLDRLAISI
ncbi:MAG TPA: ParB/RepB/Spo0J family partition protein [Candidatus Saccharimonadales bacterium]|nr:ParB/RepB/Spo0J family partition protein [Candidatus Saccharimonadales bacterium]